MSDQEKKQQRIYDLINAETKLKKIPEFLYSLHSALNLILDCSIWGVLENKTNATFHPNIASLQIAIEEESNKLPDEFILKACKSFPRHVDTIIEKNGGLLIKFTVLCRFFIFLFISLNKN